MMLWFLWSILIGYLSPSPVTSDILPCTVYSIKIIDNWRLYRERHKLKLFEYREEHFLERQDIFHACASAQQCASQELANHLKTDIQKMGVYFTCNFQVLNLAELKTIAEKDNFRDRVCPVRHLFNSSISNRYLFCGCGAQIGIDPCGQGSLL